MKKVIVLLIICVVFSASFVSAENIRLINLDFVSINNAGNSADSSGYGAVNYNYRIGKYEITNSQWIAVCGASGGRPIGNPSDAYDNSAVFTETQQPTNCVSWYEAAQFCNYLTSGDKSKGAYQFSGNNANPADFLSINRTSAQITYGTIYVLPTEDEWYKAAFFKPDGSGYSLCTNGLNTIPVADEGWNYYGGLYNTPWNVGFGTQEQNGTFDILGNVAEWNEELSSDQYFRGLLGGSYNSNPFNDSGYFPAIGEGSWIGFRIASIPEPASLLLLGLGSFILRRKK